MAAEHDDSALVPYQPQTAIGLVRPLVDPQAARAAIAEYEALKAAIVRPDDIQRIQGRDFLKKSFWRRVATCFGLSLELVSENRGFDESGKLFYSVVYRAVAPNGRGMIGDGYCSTAEPGRGGWPEHNVRATAHTRAKNRAISDLVGGGEVSADEVPDYVDAEPATRQQPAQPAKPRDLMANRKPVFNVFTDTTTRKRLNALGYRHITQVEEFVAMVNKDGDASKREDCEAVLAKLEAEAEKAKAAAGSLESIPPMVP